MMSAWRRLGTDPLSGIILRLPRHRRMNTTFRQVRAGCRRLQVNSSRTKAAQVSKDRDRSAKLTRPPGAAARAILMVMRTQAGVLAGCSATR